MSHFDFIFLICYVNIVLDWVKKSFSKTLIDAVNVTEHYRCFSTCPEPELIRAVANFRSLLELFSLWENKTVEMISPRAAYSLWIYFFSDVTSVLVSLTLSRDISSPQTQNPLILKAVTITLAAFSHAKWCHQMCSHAVTPISLLSSKSSDQIHAREMRWNSPHLSVWPDDNITRRGQRFPAFPSMWRKCSRYYWSAPLPYCFSICRANAALLPSQQYPDLLAPLAYVICTCYCTHTHTHT